MAGRRKVLMIGLDGYESTLADRMIAGGELPAIARLRQSGRSALLEHGSARRTGLAYEHFSSGLSPEAANRWSAVYFDKDNYAAWQEDVRFEPFTRHMNSRVVIFDTPYFDMDGDPRALGVVAWGAHDPGTSTRGRPESLVKELGDKFGPYPAKEWIYGFAWPSPDKCRQMGSSLAAAVDLRSEATRWLLTERLPDWDMGIVVISELHSAAEGLWHGIDPCHPLHLLPSAELAARGIEEVYRAVDRMLGRMLDLFPDTTLFCFSMHGMGPNESDVASMALLPDLMFRKSFGKSMIEPLAAWLDAPDGIPLLEEQESWRIPMRYASSFQRLKHGAIDIIKPLVRRGMLSPAMGTSRFARASRLSWMPAIHFQPYWKDMTAFALPSFYDGRIRVNLQGRESNGLVRREEYARFCDELSDMLLQCVNPRTGGPVVQTVEKSSKHDPLEVEASEPDLTIVWNGAVLAIDHPDLGTFGPLPYRRPGGHTGGHGVAYISGQDIQPEQLGIRSAFDIVPTAFELLGETAPNWLSGNQFAR